MSPIAKDGYLLRITVMNLRAIGALDDDGGAKPTCYPGTIKFLDAREPAVVNQCGVQRGAAPKR
jgi:hypothetical protein